MIRAATLLLLFLAASALLSLFAVPALAHDYKAGSIEIGHPWMRPVAGAGKTGGAYVTLANKGRADDRLLRASSAAAEKVELHTHEHDGGVMRMRAVPAVAVKAGETVRFEPGGLHIMLIGLKAPPKLGEKLPLTLVFEKAGSVAVEILVERGGGAQGHKH